MNKQISERAPLKTLSVFFDKHQVLGAMMIALALIWFYQFKIAANVLSTGFIGDTDDAMRLVEARDFLSGQGWFDLTQYRLNPPQGVFMHWSRFVDAGLAGFISFFSVFTDRLTAEKITVLAWPAILQAIFFFLVLKITHMLAGARALLPAVILCGFQWLIAAQFAPGRIDHHNVQIILSVLCVFATLAAFYRPRFAILAGVAASFAVAIGLEGAFVLALSALFYPLAWLAHGKIRARALHLFGLSFSLCSLAAFAATIPVERYFIRACDAQSLATLVLAVAGGVLCIILASTTEHLSNFKSRLCALLVAGVAFSAVAIPIALSCRTGPFGGLSEIAQREWISHIAEAKGLLEHLRSDFLGILIYAAPLAIAFVASLAAFRLNAQDRWRFGLVAAIVCIQTALSFYQVRSTVLAYTFGIPCIAYCIAILRERNQFFMAVLYIIAVPAFWVLPGMIISKDNTAAKILSGNECKQPLAFVALKNYAPGLALTSIDLGAYVLVHTPHSVLAAPYHRDIEGIDFSLSTFQAPAEEALKRLRAHHVQYIFMCDVTAEIKNFMKSAPDSLAAALAKGEPLKGLLLLDAPMPMRAWKIN